MTALLEHQSITTQEPATADLYFGLVSTLAHDIRSPLATILGYAELLSAPEFAQDPEFITGAQRVIQKNGRAIDRLVRDGLLVAEIDSGRLKLNFAPLDVTAFTRLVIDECQAGYGHPIELQVLSGPLAVCADAIYLREVILNLIDNACKYSQAGNPVQVSIRRAGLAGFVEISVTDQGIGIAEGDFPVLFTRFGKIKNETNYTINSNGLGLYIVKYIIESHHGFVRVESTVNHGSSFIVSLPYEESVFSKPGE